MYKSSHAVDYGSLYFLMYLADPRQGLFSLSGKMYYHQISWTLEAERLDQLNTKHSSHS